MKKILIIPFLFLCFGLFSQTYPWQVKTNSHGENPDTCNVLIGYPTGSGNLTGRMRPASFQTLADSLESRLGFHVDTIYKSTGGDSLFIVFAQGDTMYFVGSGGGGFFTSSVSSGNTTQDANGNNFTLNNAYSVIIENNTGAGFYVDGADSHLIDGDGASDVKVSTSSVELYNVGGNYRYGSRPDYDNSQRVTIALDTSDGFIKTNTKHLLFSDTTATLATQYDISGFLSSETQGIDDVIANDPIITTDRTINVNDHEIKYDLGTGYFTVSTDSLFGFPILQAANSDIFLGDWNGARGQTYLGLQPSVGGATLSVDSLMIFAAQTIICDEPYHTLKVGINKNPPTQALDVFGNGLFSGTLTASNLSGTNTGDQDLSGLLLKSDTASMLAHFLERNNNLSDLTNTTTARTNLGLGSLAQLSSLTIDDAFGYGNILTTNRSIETAGSAFSITTNSGANRTFVDDVGSKTYLFGDIDAAGGTNYFGVDDQNSYSFVTNASTNIKFGINTITPTQELDVVGNGLFSGTLSASNLSNTNTGDQTFTNSSDATSHTVTLSASGGSVQLVEGSNITLTTTGTAGDGIVTIASTASGYTDEQAQDAVGAMVNTSLTYVDATPSLAVTSRNINGTAFDHTANISIPASGKTFTWDGNGGIPATGSTIFWVVPTNCTVTGWSFWATGSSPTATIDVWKIAAGTALPAVGNTIISGTKPALSSGNVVRSSTLSAFTDTTFDAGEIIGINLDAVTVTTLLQFQLEFN